ncbi:MAG TPA: hypothetical protein VH143_05505 [Kofleriaceae bacterium]|nr:hypothetical protein [Kofleriaceae bacterium]
MALAACDSGENAGIEAAKKQQADEAKHADPNDVAKKISPPVPGRAKLDCKNLIDVDKFTQLLGETQPVTIAESKSEPEAAASCSLLRGGKRLTEAEQKAQIKQHGKLGVMPGDEVCNISTFCWTIEDPDRFAKKCAEMKEKVDASLGFQACILVVATGEDDVNRYRFFDDDTKCIIQVRGGPSNVDNDLIGKCAKGAHDLIGPDQIKVTGGTPPATGSGS